MWRYSESADTGFLCFTGHSGLGSSTRAGRDGADNRAGAAAIAFGFGWWAHGGVQNMRLLPREKWVQYRDVIYVEEVWGGEKVVRMARS